MIEGLHGSNNFFKKPRMVGPTTLKSRMKKSNRKYTFSNELASNNTIVGPNDFAKIYNTLPLLQQGINGTGVRIGIIGQSDILLSDVQTYRQMFNLPVNHQLRYSGRGYREFRRETTRSLTLMWKFPAAMRPVLRWISRLERAR